MSVKSCRSLWNLKENLTKILQTNKGVVSHQVKQQSSSALCTQWKGDEEKEKTKLKGPGLIFMWMLTKNGLHLCKPTQTVTSCESQSEAWSKSLIFIMQDGTHYFLLLVSQSGSGLLREATFQSCEELVFKVAGKIVFIDQRHTELLWLTSDVVGNRFGS